MQGEGLGQGRGSNLSSIQPQKLLLATIGQQDFKSLSCEQQRRQQQGGKKCVRVCLCVRACVCLCAVQIYTPLRSR